MGRDYAAQVNVITYRGAARDMARALGFAGPAGRVEQGGQPLTGQADDAAIPSRIDLATQIRNLPRKYLGIHSGGMSSSTA